MKTNKFSLLMLLRSVLSAASANGFAAAKPVQEQDVKTTPISYPAGMKLLAPQKVGISGMVLMLCSLCCGMPLYGSEQDIDRPTLDRWAAPYRNWHYQPDHVIPARPNIPGHEKFIKTDVPTVYQLPGSDKWYMSFIAFNGKGYNSFVAQSDDLLHWSDYRLAMGFGPKGEFDHGGRVLGAYLYESYDIKAPRLLKKKDGKFWSLYGCYPRQGGYELRPGYEGVAVSDDGLSWRRAKDSPILSVHDDDRGEWEQSCIYQPWLVEHEGRYFNFYNAAKGGFEQLGAAFSTDLLNWSRHKGNPVVANRPGGYDARFAADGKVFRDGDHWTMFYFGVGRGGAHIMIAFSRDLLHWTAHPEPLYKAGGNPSGLDKRYAHKISLLWNPTNETWYMYYCAVGNKGRGIGLITSKPLHQGPEPQVQSDASPARKQQLRLPCSRSSSQDAGNAKPATDCMTCRKDDKHRQQFLETFKKSAWHEQRPVLPQNSHAARTRESAFAYLCGCVRNGSIRQ